MLNRQRITKTKRLKTSSTDNIANLLTEAVPLQMEMESRKEETAKRATNITSSTGTVERGRDMLVPNMEWNARGYLHK